MFTLLAAVPEPVDVPVEELPAFTDDAAVAVFAGAITAVVRKIMLRTDPTALDGKPYILLFVSAGVALVGGFTAAIAQGKGVWEALFTAGTGWATMQGIRQAGKAIPKKAAEGS